MRINAKEWLAKEMAHPENTQEYTELLAFLHDAVNEDASLTLKQVEVVDDTLTDLPEWDTRKDPLGSIPTILLINLATYINSCCE